MHNERNTETQWKTIAKTRLPVLIVGETGTGKSCTARRIAEQVMGRHAPFVEVNAASLSPSLFCSELFGHQRGAFTGAHSAKQGLVALARGGTLFLDEIGDLPAENQAHLLSYLDTGVFRPVGSVRDERSDARIICATNRPLQQVIREGKFREDLYYRLAGVLISLPPLRKRRRDIPDLLTTLLAEMSREAGLEPPILDQGAVAHLVTCDWPGNIRQLRWLVQRVLTHHPGELVGEPEVRALLDDQQDCLAVDEITIEPLAAVEHKMVLRAMAKSGGNRTRAAAMLGITPRGLYNKLRRIDEHRAGERTWLPS